MAVREHDVGADLDLSKSCPLIVGSSGTWLSDPLQEGRFGRRPALFISAIFCIACVIGTFSEKYTQAELC